MQAQTYLNGSVKKGLITRWSTSNLVVYIAPMKFYSKKGEDAKFRKMVIDAFNAWSAASDGKIKFRFTNVLLESHINVEWRRVDRKSLGHCIFEDFGDGRLSSAEISIGLTDGRIHKQYDDDMEVYHTILHEVGHALGLDHSPYQQDIMFTPHQYGNSTLSANDKHSIKWLYRLPVGMSVQKLASQHSINTSTDIDAVIKKIDSKESDKNCNKKLQLQENRDLMQESANIGDLNRYNMMLQNISLSQNVKNYFNKNR